MNSKAKKAKKQAVINNSTANILSKEELTRRTAMLQEGMKAATWRELSQDAFPFSNSSEGFQSAKAWALELAAANDKHQIVLGLEPTGHYWFCLAAWMVSNDISVVRVNPYAVKQTKELEDNSQRKVLFFRLKEHSICRLFFSKRSSV